MSKSYVDTYTHTQTHTHTHKIVTTNHENIFNGQMENGWPLDGLFWLAYFVTLIIFFSSSSS